MVLSPKIPMKSINLHDGMNPSRSCLKVLLHRTFLSFTILRVRSEFLFAYMHTLFAAISLTCLVLSFSFLTRISRKHYLHPKTFSLCYSQEAFYQLVEVRPRVIKHKLKVRPQVHQIQGGLKKVSFGIFSIIKTTYDIDFFTVKVSGKILSQSKF